MKFKDAQAVGEIVWQMWWSDWFRSQNRARINSLFNGDPPYTEAEAKDNNIQTNVNFLEPAQIAADARRQFENAILKPGVFFNVRGDKGPKHKRNAWSRTVTKRINKVMKTSLPYLEMQRQVFAQLILHGIGPKEWLDRQRWYADFVGIDDLLIPSNTYQDLSNLERFAVYRRYTPGKLLDALYSKTSDSVGWNKKAIQSVLENLRKTPEDGAQWPNYLWPEKFTEDWKENSGFWYSDAVPAVAVWDFFFLDDDGELQRRIILDTVTEAGNYDMATAPTRPGKDKMPTNFLYESRKGYGKIQNVLNIQFADGANATPFRYHSIRSLGFLLYALGHLQNRTRCRFNDAVFESMNWYFRNVASDDREKLEMITLTNMGIIPDGLTVLQPNERHLINESLVGSALSMNGDLMARHSAAYVQDNQTKEDPEETATKTMAKVQAAAAMVTGMLNRAYSYQKFEYEEVCRRFCLKDSKDPDVIKVREQCKQDGVDDEFFDVSSWEIEPERVSGGGMKGLEIAIADKLMAIRPLLDPEPQREVTRDYILAVSDDPTKADELVPENPIKVSDAVHDANLCMGTLMQGIPVAIKTGMNHIEYVETLITLLQQMVAQVEQNGGMTTPDKLNGFATVYQHIEQHIAIIAQDKSEKQRVKQYQDIMGRIGNLIKAFAQRLQEQAKQQQQQGGGVPPEVMGKIQAMIITAQAQANIKERQAQQKERRDEQKHMLKMSQSQESHNVELMQKEQELSMKARHALFNPES